MRTRPQLAAFGLTHNPFSSEVPLDALTVSDAVEHFGWRVGTMIAEGGFACVSGESGTGKSVTLRLLARRLGALRDVQVATRSTSSGCSIAPRWRPATTCLSERMVTLVEGQRRPRRVPHSS
jgi:energy-coupling factor transporter ATP-binding protein EcfA2